MSKIGMRFAAPLAVICLILGGVKPAEAQTITGTSYNHLNAATDLTRGNLFGDLARDIDTARTRPINRIGDEKRHSES